MSMIALVGWLCGLGLIGLIVFSYLVRDEPGRSFFRMLAIFVVVTGVAGLFVLRFLPVENGSATGRMWFGVSLMWLSWVGLAAFIVQALRRRFPQAVDVLQAGGALSALAPVAGWIVARMLG